MNTDQKQKEFQDWVASIEERITEWKQTLPPDIANKLNGLRPNSLIILENYIIHKYENYKNFIDDELAYNAALSYAGEMFRKAFGYAEWYMELRVEHNEKNSPIFAKPGILIKSQPVIVLNFWRAFSAKKEKSINQNFTLAKRLLAALSSEVKYESTYGTESTDYWKEIKGEAIEEKPKVIDKGRSYENFILLVDSNFQLFEAANLIKATFDKRKKVTVSYQFVNNGYFKLILESDYEFHFQMNRAKHIVEESKEMARDHKGKLDREKIAQCEARIEFWGDEDDMLYFNELSWILQAFSDQSKFFVFDLQQGFLE